MKPKMRLLQLAVAITLLPGCMLMGPDYKRPETQVPAQFSEPEVAQVDAAVPVSKTWWELYQDPVLNDLVSKALQNNTDIQVAVARVEEADAFLREVGAALFPQIDLDSSATRSRVTELGAFPAFNGPYRENYNIKLGTSFELDFWGKLRRAKESAKAQALATVYARDTVELSLSGLVASNYLLLRSLEAQLAISRDTLKTREESLALTKRRLEGGVASALDVHQAEVARSNLVAQIADLTRQRAIIEHQLAVLTGVMDLKIAQGDIKDVPTPPVPPAGLPSSLLEARPDVRQAEQNMIAANAKIGVAKAALFPTISLTANYGGESADLSDVLKSAARIWTGGLALNLPIFDSGRLNARVDQATAQQKQALASYQGAIQTAFKEVNDALVTVRQSAEREAALQSSEEAAMKAMEIAQNRYKSGYSAYIDVLDSQRVYNEAALAYIQSRQARLVATVDLFKSLGGGWQSGN
ncbi:MAG TPA: efflux transporter outer membrane subunit [Methylophilaceae bacterium]|nr:efflux transporter outer membrane subunit [Methylophilaceae bacterium]